MKLIFSVLAIINNWILGKPTVYNVNDTTEYHIIKLNIYIKEKIIKKNGAN